jgi:hypothetical protein
MIEQAYRVGEALGLEVWCQDEAGPYQAIPQPGASWQPEGDPAHQPHEYVPPTPAGRPCTAKLLTLFHPATGELRAQAVEQATNAVLHPWLRRELTAILDRCPPVAEPLREGRRWVDWDWHDGAEGLDTHLPPVRVLLIWDNLAGHRSPDLVRWCAERGICLLYTPLGGSWLNMAESVRRIVVRRALAGQHPSSAQEVMAWLEETVAGWNQAPTPFAWGGKRAARRQHARARRHALGGSGACTPRALARRRSSPRRAKGYTHAK